CERPQTIFWTARASVKSAAVTARSWVIGVRKRPKLWRIPMPSVSNRAVPIKISRARLSLGIIVPDIPEAILARGEGRQQSHLTYRCLPTAFDWVPHRCWGRQVGKLLFGGASSKAGSQARLDRSAFCRASRSAEHMV